MAASSSNDHPGYPRIERIVFGQRSIILAIIGLVTLFMLYQVSQIRIDAGFKKQLPLTHEYMQTFKDYEKEFGGANRVLIAVIDESGNMFNKKFFVTLEAITKELQSFEGVDPSRVKSLFTPNVRFTEIVEGGFAGGNVIPATFDTTAPDFNPDLEIFEKIRTNIVKAGIIGRLVAKDFSGAMVQGELVSEDSVKGGKLDYQSIGNKLEALRTKYESKGITIRIVGFSKIVGDIANGVKSVASFFLLTIAFTWLLLYAYSTSGKLASLTVAVALVAVIWMLGVLRLMGFGIDPMNILTPFLIFAIGVSHGEQMINRYRGQIFYGGLEEGTVEELRTRRGVDSFEAAKRAFRSLLVPGAVALAAGCIGFATILLIPIQIIRELSITATIGVGITLLTNLILLPILLSYTKLANLEKKRGYRLRQITKFDRIWSFLARLSKPVPAAILIALGVATWMVAKHYGDKVIIGDAQDGVAELRPNSRYNIDARDITKRFALSTDMMNVIAEVGPYGCTQNKVMDVLDRFAWEMRNVEGVQQVITNSQVAKMINAGYNEGSPRWREIPRDSQVMAQAQASIEPDTGLKDTVECKAMPIIIFTKDHKAETIDRVTNAVKDFRLKNGNLLKDFRVTRDAAIKAGGENYQTDQVNLRLATGNLGVMAATNEVVKARAHPMLWLVYGSVFLMTILCFWNPLASVCIVLPLVLVTALSDALMYKLGIGLKVNTLTVVALGVGIGVDYAIYIFARMNELLKQGKPLTQAYFEALKTTGIAIFYTALTLAAGVATWIFSTLKFQADMGLMLTFMFVVNMIAAIVFLPALGRWLLRPNEKN
jgi:uncharacterized protein